MKTIICDIDGTIADLSHRLHHIKKENPDWEKFYDEVDKDEPIEEIINIVINMFLNDDHIVLFLTGRNESCRDKTKKWINEHTKIWEQWSMDDGYFFELFDDCSLLMRKKNDYRPDTEVKPDLLNEYLKDNPETEIAFILEDRTSMVKKWRELGYTCLQVADGNF